MTASPNMVLNISMCESMKNVPAFLMALCIVRLPQWNAVAKMGLNVKIAM